MPNPAMPPDELAAWAARLAAHETELAAARAALAARPPLDPALAAESAARLRAIAAAPPDGPWIGCIRPKPTTFA